MSDKVKQNFSPYVFGDELEKRALEVAKEYEELKREAQRIRSVPQKKPSRLTRLLITVLEKLTALLERTQ